MLYGSNEMLPKEKEKKAIIRCFRLRHLTFLPPLITRGFLHFPRAFPTLKLHAHLRKLHQWLRFHSYSSLCFSYRKNLLPFQNARRRYIIYITALGDGGMKNPNTRIALEAWNFCNEVGNEAPSMGSPRFADCAPLSCPIHQDSLEQRLDSQGSKCEVYHLVNEIENKLAAGDKFPVSGFISYKDPDLFANEKERYLGSLCKIHDDIEEEP
ncbi:hypothetical protein V5N11_030070 [Cardamine amara subsp. amara]|uniref:DUF7705 domain-containing protein n=1 Tax=Cardamine amara subsp. amara TaxID=228776 RepID=A0ABD0ZXA2_CARAN